MIYKQKQTKKVRYKKKYNKIPTKLKEADFSEFFLPYLTKGSRGPGKNLSHYELFGLILRVLSTGMTWQDLEIPKGDNGKPVIHYTNIYRTFKYWLKTGCFERIFESTVIKLFLEKKLDLSIIHGDGTTQAAKKGGDNIGYNQHKKIKGDKVVALCDRNVNVIAPFISAAGNKNECALLQSCLKNLKEMATTIGFQLKGSIISLDSIYNSKSNRKAIFNRKMIPNIKLRKCDLKRKGRNQFYNSQIFKERFRTIERLFAWEDKFKRVLIRFERISSHFYGFKMLAYSLINLRHFITTA